MKEIDELIEKYKREIHNYEKYIDGQWACEIHRISGMKIAVEVLKDAVKDLKQLKSSLPNKQIDGIKELIKKIDEEMFAYPEMEPEQDDEATEDFKDGYNQASKVIIDYLNELPTQQDEVVVPEFVAEWFEIHKNNLERAIFTVHVDIYDKSDTDHSEFEKWANFDKNKPIETLIRMKDGYTVEKEQLYYVQLLKDADNELKEVCLSYREDTQQFFLDQKAKNQYPFKTQFTEAEIKAIDERYWAFAVPVEEDE